MRKGRFPPFGSVFTEFELWESALRHFLAFLTFGEIARNTGCFPGLEKTEGVRKNETL